MLKVRGTDVQTDNIHLDLIGYGESPQVRGRDVLIPGAEGRYVPTGSRESDTYRFSLQGYVQGTGADPDARALSWRQATDTLLAVMDLSLDPGTVDVGPAAPARFPDASPYLGLTGDRMINARVVSIVRGTVHAHMSYQGWSFEMESVEAPLGWQDAESP
jgi:hypothetical protein